LFESNELNAILRDELALGNEIAEESAWPPKCKKLIILKHRFIRNHKTTTLTYNQINDPHYWYADYSTIDQTECLACKFK